MIPRFPQKPIVIPRFPCQPTVGHQLLQAAEAAHRGKHLAEFLQHAAPICVDRIARFGRWAYSKVRR